MVQAQYISTGSVFPEEYHHYGLDLDLYTHFTSPIRRYADLVVRKEVHALCTILYPSYWQRPMNIILHNEKHLDHYNQSELYCLVEITIYPHHSHNA